MSFGHLMLTSPMYCSNASQMASEIAIEIWNCWVAGKSLGWINIENVRFFPRSLSHWFVPQPRPAVWYSAQTTILASDRSSVAKYFCSHRFVESVSSICTIFQFTLQSYEIFCNFDCVDVTFLSEMLKFIWYFAHLFVTLQTWNKKIKTKSICVRP